MLLFSSYPSWITSLFAFRYLGRKKGKVMQVQAPKGQYRVIGRDRIDTLSSTEGPLWKTATLLKKP